MISVAYCFYGQPRKVNDGFKIVQEFVKSNPEANIDFFYHTWFAKSESPIYYETSPWRNIEKNSLQIDQTIIEDINALYNPKAFQIDPPTYLPNEYLKDSLLFNKTSNIKRNNINNTLSQKYSYQRVRQVLEKYVNENNKHYDFIILSRFDFLNTINIKIRNLCAGKLYVSNTTEQYKAFCNLYVSDYEIFLKITNVYDNLSKICNDQKLIDKYERLSAIECSLNAEELISLNYLYYYDDYKDVEFSPLIPNFI